MSVSAAEALERLKAGNDNYVNDRDTHPHNDAAHRASLKGGQQPFASILTCADSRVSPELIFDQGIGDLFVVRVAGNIADDPGMGSLEYASMHLGVKLVVVMGHRSCGAVSAAVDNVDATGPATGTHIDSLIDAIRPAVKASAGSSDLLDASIRTNATMVADKVRTSEAAMAKLVAEGRAGRAGVLRPGNRQGGVARLAEPVSDSPRASRDPESRPSRR